MFVIILLDLTQKMLQCHKHISFGTFERVNLSTPDHRQIDDPTNHTNPSPNLSGLGLV